MKPLLLFCLAIHVCIILPAQRVDSLAIKPSTDYLKKSKSQKTAAWILLGGGTLLATIGAGITTADATEVVLTGLFTGEEAHTSSAGPILSLVGLTAMVGSIPLFIAARKNKKKAAASFSFKMENATQVNRLAFVKSQYPAVAYRIRL